MLKWLELLRLRLRRRLLLLLLLLLMLLLLLRVGLDVFKAYEPSRDRVVAGQKLLQHSHHGRIGCCSCEKARFLAHPVNPAGRPRLPPYPAGRPSFPLEGKARRPWRNRKSIDCLGTLLSIFATNSRCCRSGGLSPDSSGG